MQTTTVVQEPRSAIPAPPTLRRNMESIAHALRVELGSEPDAALSLLINKVQVTFAPTTHGRLAAFFKLADADLVSRKVMVSALSEAAAWGAQGETRRFVVLDTCFALLWSPPPLQEEALLEQLHETIAIAQAVAELAVARPH